MVYQLFIYTHPELWLLICLTVTHVWLLCFVFFWLYAVLYALLTRSPMCIIRIMYFTLQLQYVKSVAGIMASCNICKKRVQNHSFQLKCSSCRGKVHLKCLPVVDKHDSIYIHRESNIWFCTVCTQDLFPFNGIDDDCEFLETLAEFQQWDSLIPFDILVAQNKIFSPFELNEDLNLPLFDSDPDIQFYNNQCNNSLYSCNYYLEDSFNKRVADLNISPGCLSMIHTNIRSTAKHMNKFDLYLNNLKHEFPIIALSETWLNENNCDRYGMNGYNAEHNCRPNRGGGGVSLYIKDCIEYTLRDELCFQNETLETLFIEINKEQFNKQQDIIIGVIYRPPDTDINEFNDCIMQCLTQIKAEKKLHICWEITILTSWILINMLLARILQMPCFPILSFLLSQNQLEWLISQRHL